MKLRNLAFFGVMASILGINGAYAADTATVIASQAYVDAQNALDEKVANKEDDDYTTLDATAKGSTTKYPSMNTLTTALTTVDVSGAVSNGDNALSLTDVTNKAPSVHAIKGMVTTTVRDGTNATDATVPTEKAVRDAIADAAVDVSDAVDDGTNGTETAAQLAAADDKAPSTRAVKSMVSTTNMITADTTSGEITAVAAGDSAHVPTTAVVSDVIKKMKSIESTETDDSNFAVVGVTQTNGQVTVTTGPIKQSAVSGLESSLSGKEDKSNKVQTLTAESTSTQYPSAKIVYDSLTAKQDKAKSTVATGTYTTIEAGDGVASNLVKLDTALATKANSADVYTTTAADAKFEVAANKVTATEFDSNATSDTKYPTVAAVADKLATKTNASDILEDSETWDASVQNAKRNIEYPSVAAVTKYVEGATSGKLNKNTAITAKNNSIVNYDANGLVTGGTLLEDATGGLTGVNAETAGNMGCSASNPCVLTYLGGSGSAAKYRWTAMDTDQLTAQ